jgi:hypothetical protein
MRNIGLKHNINLLVVQVGIIGALLQGWEPICQFLDTLPAQAASLTYTQFQVFCIRKQPNCLQHDLVASS